MIKKLSLCVVTVFLMSCFNDDFGDLCGNGKGIIVEGQKGCQVAHRVDLNEFTGSRRHEFGYRLNDDFSYHSIRIVFERDDLKFVFYSTGNMSYRIPAYKLDINLEDGNINRFSFRLSTRVEDPSSENSVRISISGQTI